MNSDAPSNGLVGKRVVIVEDDASQRTHMETLVRSIGMNVAGSAVDGQAGLEMILRERPDIILLDIVLPELDGFEVLRKVRKEIKTCVVMLTAYTHFVENVDVLKAAGVIVKPVHSITFQVDLKSIYLRWLAKNG